MSNNQPPFLRPRPESRNSGTNSLPEVEAVAAAAAAKPSPDAGTVPVERIPIAERTATAESAATAELAAAEQTVVAEQAAGAERAPSGNRFIPVDASPSVKNKTKAKGRSRADWLAYTIFSVMGISGIVCLVLAIILGNAAANPPDNAQNSGAPTQNVPGSDSSTSSAKPGDSEPSTTENDLATPGIISSLADREWIAERAAATKIPERMLKAYAGASLAINQSIPSCGLGWNTLAAIGFVETEHGTMNGASVDAAGVVSPPIIGVPLDGNNVSRVPDTDQGQLDGDTTWDHAVGPMQFIPTTWKAYASDGNGDGVADINQIDDATISAARFLCTAGGDLTVDANWIKAIAAYNPDVEYNNRVATAATQYANATTK